ncbi:family S53 protease [Auricularia subglabra TFB-10046 SS5]|nr:family S53 protease [Auricularia subglabra TFB-10046 SS5]
MVFAQQMVAMRSLLLMYLSVAFVYAAARPPERAMSIHEQIFAAPPGFRAMHGADPDHMLKMRIALRQNNIAGLEEELMAVSDPASPRYGQHLSKEQVEEYVRPPPEVVAAVKAWLSDNGITPSTISPAGDWLAFSVPVSKANTIFRANFTVFSHGETGDSSVRTLSYSIPTELRGAIDVVHPTTTFPNLFGLKPTFTSPLQKKAKRQVPGSCNTVVTPNCLLTLYNYDGKCGLPRILSNQLGVSGAFIEQFANQADLTQFLAEFRPDLSSLNALNTTFSLQTIDGGTNPQDRTKAGIEANLDIQYTVGIATAVPTLFISVGEQSQDGALEGFLDIITFLLGQSNPPQVLTTSYGQNENTISLALATKLCNAFMQLGARGTSILFASGDGGVAGSQSSRCTTFVPTFPSGCPFMTSVGATQNIGPEIAASFSAGGFSNFFPMPSYQARQVAAFKQQLGNTNAGKFNASGRGFPDVAAQGLNVQIVLEGQTGGVAGTSASSPIFASFVALLNERLADSGRPPLGFLNPFLYSNAGVAALNDITTGNNPGCNTNGFPAVAGWDPVTGLGTPDFTRLMGALGL